MKLHQLKYLVAVADHDLNITAAALTLNTVQPGVSKQIMLLEAELGFQLFVRRGRSLVRVTPAGERVIVRAREILREMQAIRSLAAESRKDEEGSLSIATTHTQARYVLPGVLQEFRKSAPKVQVHLHQGDAEQMASMVAREQVDLVIATGSENHFGDLIRLPCYRWRRVIVVPRNHPLTHVARPALAELADYPLITYAFSIAGPSSLLDLFGNAGITPDIVLTAWDADVLKTYLRGELGIGILAELAIDPVEDGDLAVIDASHLFPEHTTWIGFRRGTLLRRFVYDFITQLAPHLSRHDVQRIEPLPSQAEVDIALAQKKIPLRRQAGVLSDG